MYQRRQQSQMPMQQGVIINNISTRGGMRKHHRPQHEMSPMSPMSPMSSRSFGQQWGRGQQGFSGQQWGRDQQGFSGQQVQQGQRAFSSQRGYPSQHGRMGRSVFSEPIDPSQLMEDPSGSGYLIDPATGMLYDPNTLLPIDEPMSPIVTPIVEDPFAPAVIGEFPGAEMLADTQIDLVTDNASRTDYEVITTPIMNNHMRQQRTITNRYVRDVITLEEPVATTNIERGVPTSEYIRGTTELMIPQQELLQGFSLNCL